MKVLIPTDLSKNSIKTIEKILGSIDTLNMEVELLHVLDLNDLIAPELIDQDSLLNEKVKTQLAEIKDVLLSSNPELNINFDVLNGIFSEKLFAKIDSDNTDLLILPSRTRKGMERLFSTRNAMAMLGEVNCATLVIPFDFEGKYDKMVVAVDGSNMPSEESINQLKVIGNALKIKHEFIHVDDFSEKNLSAYVTDDVSKNMGDIKIKHSVDKIEGVIRAANQSSASVIGCITSKKSFFEKVFKDSFSRELVKRNENPVLIITQ